MEAFRTCYAGWMIPLALQLFHHHENQSFSFPLVSPVDITGPCDLKEKRSSQIAIFLLRSSSTPLAIGWPVLLVVALFGVIIGWGLGLTLSPKQTKISRPGCMGFEFLLLWGDERGGHRLPLSPWEASRFLRT